MTDSLSNSSHIEATVSSQPSIRAILEWLDASPLDITDQLRPLQSHLVTLRACLITDQQRASVLECLYARSISVVNALRPSLTSVLLPIPRKTRQLIRNLQDLLQMLAEDLLNSLSTIDGQPAHDLLQPQELTLWRSLNALAQHLLISNLTASPVGVGIWQQFHRTYETARGLNICNITPQGASNSLQDIYYSAILLSCAQPASFTSREVDFVATYLERFVDQIDLIDSTTAMIPAAFWIDPARDAPAFANSRKTAPPETPVLYFSCDRIAALLVKQLAAIEANDAQQISLPDFAGTPAGRGVLRRLITYWGKPGKRRFPRRRQNYRAVLCAGLDNLWHLFQHDDAATIETSNWMITNESPDGYAVMHVSGKTGDISIGDVIAIRTDSGKNWQICIVRWALSENQEHLELGLQILATRAIPAFIVRSDEANNAIRLPVLILPGIPALRSTEMLVVPTGTLDDQPRKLVLVVEKENIEIREVRNTRLDEQNSHIEVFSIEPDMLTD